MQKPEALLRDSNITQIFTKVDSKPHIYFCQGLVGCCALSNLLFIVSLKLFQSSQVEHDPLLPLTLWPWSWTFTVLHIFYVKCEYFMNQEV